MESKVGDGMNAMLSNLSLKLVVMIFMLPGLLLAGYVINFKLQHFDINFVSVSGDLTTNQHREIYARLASQSLKGVTINELQEQLERKLWVAKVSVKRQWPDSIQVNVVPEVAIALWNDDALINDKGEIFKSDYVQIDQLAQLYGPNGSEKEVMQKFQQLNSVLLKMGRSIDLIRLDTRGSWMFKNDFGVVVLLGKDQLMERMQRLIAIAEHLNKNNQLDEITMIDTRYSNGAAVSWKQSLDSLEIAESFKRQREQKL
ncbi:MAG: cell division protein FtsQ [Candidatus Azotimanducaceae bacterium]|jgi:cell division protein FtsQ